MQYDSANRSFTVYCQLTDQNLPTLVEVPFLKIKFVRMESHPVINAGCLHCTASFFTKLTSRFQLVTTRRNK